MTALTTLETAAARPLTVLVTFSYGPSTTRYCRWTSDLVYNGDTYTAAPSMEVRLDRVQGGLDDDPLYILARSDIAPLNTLARPFRHSRVTVRVAEAVPGEDGTYHEIWFGRVAEVTRNPDKRIGLVRLKIAGIRARLNPADGLSPGLTMRALSTCGWKFGDKNCKVNVPALESAHTITEIRTDGLVNRLTLSGTLPQIAARYRRGSVRVNGLTLTIRDSMAGNKINLDNAIPPEWLSATCALRPGCQKTLDACRTTWTNESEFGGFGYSMPDYNPLFSKGT